MRVPGLGRASRMVAQLQDRFGIHAVILMYHRVIDIPGDPWGLNVAPRHFAEHLEILRRLGCVVRLEELTGMLRRRERSPSKAVVITFDDGYADNLHEAKPLLEEARLPATIFMTSGDVGRTHEFWWDELEKMLLQPGELPEVLNLTINGQAHQWKLGADARYGRDQFEMHKHWRADSEERPTARHRLYRSIYDLIQGIAKEAREAVMEDLRHLSDSIPGVRPTHRALSPDETRQLSEGNWIEIGAHTVNHQALPTQSADVQRDEIAGSKSRLEEIVGQPVTSFSYPYGLHSDETVRIVREAGFTCACACLDRSVRQSSDPFRLPRLMVEDWSGSKFEARLQEWFDDPSFAHA